MALIERRVSDRAMLKLLRSWLRAGIIEGGVYSDSDAGTPQGSPISPLLCNIALSVLDEALQPGDVADGKRRPLRRRLGRPLSDEATSRRRLVRLPRRRWPHSGCDCTPTRPGSSTSRTGRRALTSWAFTITWWSPGSGPVVTTSNVGRRNGPWPPSEAQGSRDDRSALRRTVVRCRGGATQPRAAGLGGLLPLRQLSAEVQRHRQLRRGTDGHPGQQQARTLGAQLGHSIHLSSGSRASGSTRSLGTCDYGTAHALR